MGLFGKSQAEIDEEFYAARQAAIPREYWCQKCVGRGVVVNSDPRPSMPFFVRCLKCDGTGWRDGKVVEGDAEPSLRSRRS